MDVGELVGVADDVDDGEGVAVDVEEGVEVGRARRLHEWEYCYSWRGRSGGAGGSAGGGGCGRGGYEMAMKEWNDEGQAGAEAGGEVR